MKRGFIRVSSLLMVVFLLFGSLTAFAAGRARPSASLRPEITDSQREKIMSELQNYIDKGLAINGARNASLLPVPRPPIPPVSTVKSVTLAPMPDVMGMYYDPDETNPYSVEHPILVSISPADAVFNWIAEISCVPAGIAEIKYYPYSGRFGTHASYPYLCVTGTGTGTVKLTVTADNGRKATRTIQIRDWVPIKSITAYGLFDLMSQPNPAPLSYKTLVTGDELPLACFASPTSATYAGWGEPYPLTAAKLSSSNDQVASVDASPIGAYMEATAVAFAKKPGTAVITVAATDGGKAKTSFRLSVQGRLADSILLDAILLQPGAKKTMTYTIDPSDAYDKALTWSTSDKKIATVDSAGRVTGVAPGVCTISCLNKASGKRASATATVTYMAPDTNTRYHFIGIGNSVYNGYASDLPGCANDLGMMAAAYEILYGPMNAQQYHNLPGAGILSLLDYLAYHAGIGSEDVTVFYYSGHGAWAPYQQYRGALCGTDGGLVTVDQVQSYLDKVPGTVVVILDSCLSGQYITGKGLSKAAKIAQARSFNQSWVNAFAGSKAKNYTSKALTDSAVSSKYKILVACDSMEVSWGGNFGWFSYWLGKAIGMEPDWDGTFAPGDMEADVNADKVVTLNEAFRFVKDGVDSESDPNYWQTTSVWPANDPAAIINDFNLK